MVYVIRDDALAPKGAKIIDFSGPNPIKAYKASNWLLRRIFEAKGTNMYEPTFQWDFSEDPRSFLVIVFVKRDFDKFTGLKVQIKIQGKQPSDPNKPGNAKIELSGFIETKYPTESLFAKLFFFPFLYLYHIAIYNKTRRQYIEYLRRGIDELENELREILKIPVRAI